MGTRTHSSACLPALPGRSQQSPEPNDRAAKGRVRTGSGAQGQPEKLPARSLGSEPRRGAPLGREGGGRWHTPRRGDGKATRRRSPQESTRAKCENEHIYRRTAGGNGAVTGRVPQQSNETAATALRLCECSKHR